MSLCDTYCVGCKRLRPLEKKVFCNVVHINICVSWAESRTETLTLILEFISESRPDFFPIDHFAWRKQNWFNAGPEQTVSVL